MLEVQLANERQFERFSNSPYYIINALGQHGPSASLIFLTHFYRELERMNHVHYTYFIRNLFQVGAIVIDKYSLRLKTKEVVKYFLRTILSKQAIRKKRFPLLMVVKTLLILHCTVIYFCLKELLLCRFIYALRRNYLNLLLVSSSWASTKAMTSTTLLKNKSTFIFFNVALKRVTASRGISCL